MDTKTAGTRVLIRPFRPGDASYIAFLHITLYRRTYRFRGIFEYYVMKGLADFLCNPDGSNLWIAESDGETIGSIAIVKTADGLAQLRWFIINEGYQGRGVGRALMETAMRFCETQGYRRVFLWTIEFLDAARHLYESYGFKLMEQKTNSEWTDSSITEERWYWESPGLIPALPAEPCIGSSVPS